MTMWFDQHQAHRINKLPYNLKYKCCQILTDVLKKNLFLFFQNKKKSELPA